MRCWVVINHRNLPTCHIPKGLGTLNATVARTSRRASVSLGDYGCAGGLECRYRFYRRYFNPSGLYLTRALRAMDDCSSLYNHYSTPERSQVKRRKTSAGAKSAKSNYLGAHLSRWGRLAARYLPATTCQLPQKKQLHREASPLLVRHWLPRETV